MGAGLPANMKRLPPLVKMAAVSGVLPTIQAFLQNGGSPDCADLEGRTLLRLAAGRGKTSVCTILLQSGADPSIADAKGVDAIAAAVLSGSPETVALLENFAAKLSNPTLPGEFPTSIAPCTQETFLPKPEAGNDEKQVDLEEGLDFGDWEPEQNIILTKTAHPECQTKSQAVQERIAKHRIIDRDPNWSDIVIAIPAMRHGKLAQPFLSETARTWIERLVFDGEPHGWLPPSWPENAADGIQDSFEKQDLVARMEMLAGELGIQIGYGDERVDLPQATRDQDLDDLPEDVLQFLGDLESAWKDPLAAYFKDIGPLPLLTQEEERMFGRLWQQDRNQDGLSGLVLGNLRFVVKEARRYQGLGLDIKDLITEGNLGLMEAAKRFDPERETRFLTYASWWIKQSIFHALSEQGGRFRLPQRVAGEVAQLNRLIAQLQDELGKEPVFAEILASSGFEERHLAKLMMIRAGSQESTEEGSQASGLEEASDLISPDLDPLEDHLQIEMNIQLQAALSVLNGKERTILTLHFGLDDQAPMTLDGIGQRMDPPISRERIRQIEERAFMKIRERCRSRLAGFLFEGHARMTTGSRRPLQLPEEWDESA